MEDILRVEMYLSCECMLYTFTHGHIIQKKSSGLETHLEGLGQVEHVPCGHVGPQQLLQEEVREHVAVLVPVVFLQGLSTTTVHKAVFMFRCSKLFNSKFGCTVVSTRVTIYHVHFVEEHTKLI
jgi:hypothetical protein